jgi:hypothetical protein
MKTKRLTAEEEKILTLLQRTQPIKKDEFLEHAEALDMDLDDHTFRRTIWKLIDRGIVELGLNWEMSINDRN